MEADGLKRLAAAIKANVATVVSGHERAVDLVLAALLCEAHVLLEGVPGTGKTLLARAFAASVRVRFNRVQFTPDLMPGDVLGTNLFDFRTSEFRLTKGPIFTDILLADELNRTPPKTQAALLQAMQERAVTIDGTTFDLGPGFMVLATQNPIEHEGTYPLPEAQLDRFLFRVVMGYPTRDEERALVTQHGVRAGMPDLAKVEPVEGAGLDGLAEARAAVAAVRASPEIVDYVVDLSRATRENPALMCGASPRAATMLLAASRAWAALDGRDFVIPDDVKTLLEPTLAHRILLAPGAELDGATASSIVAQTAEQVPAPR